MENKIVQYYPSLEGFALKLTKDKSKAKDLTQETVLKALSKSNRFDNSDKLLPWLFTIMRNTFINEFRRNKKFTRTDEQPERYESTSADSQALVSEIESALNRIKPDRLDCLKMHMKGFKYHEIAEAHHLPIGTVKSKIHIARNEFIENYG